MSTSGKFKTIDAKVYQAVALPTSEGGLFIVALPNEKDDINKVEDEIVKTGRSLHTFVETMMNTKTEADMNVILPRLNIQIVHDWSTPSDKVCLITIVLYP